MAKVGDVILVSLVDATHLSEGFKKRRNEWPYHVTLLSWFTVKDEVALQAELKDYSERQTAFTAYVGERVSFGANAEVPVNLIANPDLFKKLQMDLLGIARALQATGYDERWVGDNYRPHVTRHHDGQEGVEAGTAFEVGGFYTVRLHEGDMCVVENYFEFGNV